MSSDLRWVVIGRRIVRIRPAEDAAPPARQPVPEPAAAPAPRDEIPILVMDEDPEREVERALAEAREEGRRAGREEARRELGAFADRLEAAAAAAGARAIEELRDIGAPLAELAIAVAGRILGDEVEAGRHDVRLGVERALERIRDRAGAIVRLNPQDLAALGRAPGCPDGCAYVADPAVERGGVVVETPSGRVVHAIREELELVRAAVGRGEAA